MIEEQWWTREQSKEPIELVSIEYNNKFIATTYHVNRRVLCLRSGGSKVRDQELELGLVNTTDGLKRVAPVSAHGTSGPVSPTSPHVVVGIEPVEEVAEGSAAAVVVSDTHLSEHGLEVVFAAPVSELGQELLTDIGANAVVSQTTAFGVQELMHFVGEVVGGVFNAEHADGLRSAGVSAPPVHSAPFDRGHEHQVVSLGLTDGGDDGVANTLPDSGVHAVRVVHQAEDHFLIVLVHGCELGPEIGKSSGS